MGKGLLDPKVDFVFKNIFGSEKNPQILISFLNATLKPVEKISKVEIKGVDIEKHFIEDKYSRLDIKAITDKNEIINVEIQLKNEHNMIKRSMYYLSKMYEEQLAEGEDYSKLERTVCINILNFKYLKTDKFHTGYRLKEIESNEELTDIIEMHFIEIPKLKDDSDEKDMLVAWTEFLKDPESEKVRNLEMSIKEIREAKDELIKMSNNSKQREIYEMRAKILKDKVSALNKAREEGIEQGIKEGQYKEKINIAKKLLDVLDDDTIAIKTGLTIDKIQKLR
ncbi:Rpn family recombination-promoting nuclease/putative transposase [Clostridium botulinum]|uniref:Rpn family recombination-promoting nuclease/putative transposase n=1 Tax=Clostridium botulinum TaxID=1491 RepID=UPI0007731B6A|nr:Rpn family recombination-promoting nuclease/putative transposase [Clostridium botulinum]MBY6931185.1 PD-(D/E)XK nuclease family transposase [Clostridium botulinum]NFG21779.1 Rpn family recombination-promoting nuclease/putative transposase [Clostridium botulinum]NFO82605.1 Rpn family recombination-promoting nuclease/putative transposase [Clostridium botulinum]